MAKKDFSFRGKSFDQLVAMDLNDFGQIAGARIKRQIKRGIDKTLLKDVDEAFNLKMGGKEPKPVRTHLRHFPVLPKMVGLRLEVYKGNGFTILEVRKEMLGHLLGEFALTRKRLSHGKAGIGATKSSTAITARG